jgi:predicted O-methyltransferase YrrM
MQGESLRAYVEDLFGGEDPLLAEMRREAEAAGIPTIQVPLELGRLLQLLIVQSRARSVLEIGTLFGYSSILMAQALPAGGKITTLEVEPKHADAARRNYQRAGVQDRIEIVEGNALDSLARLEGSVFDFVFIDADKPSYPQYLDWALRLTKTGSLIVADNVWRDGLVTNPQGDPAAEAMARFNQDLARNSRLMSTIIPTRDCTDAATLSTVL